MKRPASLLAALQAVPAFLLARRALVRGWSMYPTLAPGERVLFDRLAYRRRRPQRGDVVLAIHPAQPSIRIVKRVAALPGQRVAVREGGLWVDGQLCGEAVPEAEDGNEWSLGEDEYFLLGDAPGLSTDARHFGPVRRRQILARAWLVYWPPARLRAVHGGQ